MMVTPCGLQKRWCNLKHMLQIRKADDDSLVRLSKPLNLELKPKGRTPKMSDNCRFARSATGNFGCLGTNVTNHLLFLFQINLANYVGPSSIYSCTFTKLGDSKKCQVK